MTMCVESGENNRLKGCARLEVKRFFALSGHPNESFAKTDYVGAWPRYKGEARMR